MSKVTFRIDLEYNQADFEFAIGETFDSEASFMAAVSQYATEDLISLWREYSSVADYAEIIMGEEDN